MADTHPPDDLRHANYWIGHAHGRRLHEHQPNIDHERQLRTQLFLCGQRGRAWALGELRGYRQAADLPQPLYGPKVLG